MKIADNLTATCTFTICDQQNFTSLVTLTSYPVDWFLLCYIYSLLFNQWLVIGGGMGGLETPVLLSLHRNVIFLHANVT